MPPEPVPADPPPDPMLAEEREAWLDRLAEQDKPWDLEEWSGPDDELTAEDLAELAELREAAEADARAAADAAARGLPGGQYVRPERRGPGQPGSARSYPGEFSGRAAAFGAGMALDVTPGCPELAWLADVAAGDDDRYAGASDDELAGVIAAWAKELKAAGLDGDMDVLRARAYLDLLLGIDSRPRPDIPDSPAAPADPAAPAGPPPGTVPAGFAGKVTLTIPLATLTDLADRPGEIAGIGPIDPWLARDLASAAAQNPRTTWCVTVTDEQGHAVGHGCARPQPRSHRDRDGPGFAFTAAGQHGPPGGYGTWHLSTGAGGRSCLCNGGPKCRRDHRVKQHPKWTVDQLPDGTFQWTTPSGRQYTKEPTRYPI